MMATMIAMMVSMVGFGTAAYVDTNLVGTGKVTRAAILGLKGGVWAASAGYNVRPSILSLMLQLSLTVYIEIL